MNASLVEKVVQAVLYEGYILYPYRPSVKNRQRWTFGGVFPQTYSEAQQNGDAWSMQTECLLAGGPDAVLEVSVRFLHLIERTVGELTAPAQEWTGQGALPPFRLVGSLEVGGQRYQSWQEATERRIDLRPARIGELVGRATEERFYLPFEKRTEPLRVAADGPVVGLLLREQQAIEGSVELSAAAVEEGLFKVTVRIVNQTPMEALRKPASRDSALLRALVSTHTVLHACGGEFVSLIDPPDRWRAAASECKNAGVWPVLAGEGGERDTMLSSPIILYDYPQVAPESPGDLFDCTEIDEILSLRIQTLTDDEKRDVAAMDERGRALLERTESLVRQELAGLHGIVRDLRIVEGSASGGGLEPTLCQTPGGAFAKTVPDTFWENTFSEKPGSVRVGGVELHVGDGVRLWPDGGADCQDRFLWGRTARIVSIEQDYENRVQLAVTVDDDPGAEYGAAGMIGHRFFFRPGEVEPVEPASAAPGRDEGVAGGGV